MDENTVWNNSRDIFVRAGGPIRCLHFRGHTESFESATDVLNSLGAKSKFNLLDISVPLLRSAEEVSRAAVRRSLTTPEAEKVYDAFVALLSPFFSEMKGQPREPRPSAQLPTLKRLSAAAISSSCELSGCEGALAIRNP